MSEKAESSLGRLNLRRIITDEQHEAGVRYATIVGGWRSVIAGPQCMAGSGRGQGCKGDCSQRIKAELGPSLSADELHDSLMAGCRCYRLQQSYDAAYQALFGAGQRAARVVARVAVFGEEIFFDDVAYLGVGLAALVSHFGLSAPKEQMRSSV